MIKTPSFPCANCSMGGVVKNTLLEDIP